MTQNKITELFEAALNSQDRRWDAESLAKIKAAWNGIDSGSGEFKEIVHLLDKEALGRAGIDTSILPTIRGAGDFDPMTGCNRQGQDTSLVQCLSMPGQPYFGCVVLVGEKRVRCVARRKHTWHQRFSGSHEDDRWERVYIAGASFVERADKSLIQFFSHGDLNEVHYEDFITPNTTGWQVNNFDNEEEEITDSFGEGFRKPDDSPDFYYPDTLEYQMPSIGMGSQGFAMCSPYLKVAVIGSSIVICLAAVTLAKDESFYHNWRHHGHNHPEPRRTKFIRDRTDHGGWSCRKFGAHELP